MPKSFQDEFDSATGVGGKHLAPKRALDYIVSFLTLTFLSAALAGGGILGLQLWDTGVILSGLVAQEDRVPQLEVAIVDGTNSGKAQAIGDQLLEERDTQTRSIPRATEPLACLWGSSYWGYLSCGLDA